MNISVCGIDCGGACIECNSSNPELKESPCMGCNSMEGKIFWTKYINLDVCPIYSCAKQKQFNHCGKCQHLPCEIYFKIKDPNISEEQHQNSINERVAVLKTLN